MELSKEDLCLDLLSLNPYYNGRYSWSGLNEFYYGIYRGLNPYYNGRYSWRLKHSYQRKLNKKCLNPYYNGRYSWRPCSEQQ